MRICRHQRLVFCHHWGCALIVHQATNEITDIECVDLNNKNRSITKCMALFVLPFQESLSAASSVCCSFFFSCALFLSSFASPSSCTRSPDRSIQLFISRRRRRARTLKYLKNHHDDDDDHRQHLNGNSDAQHRPMKPLQIEHPHFLASSPTIISTPTGAIQSRSSRLHENLSDREALLKSSGQAYPSSTSTDDSYEEIIDSANRQAHFPLAQQSSYIAAQSAEERPYVFPGALPSKPSREVFYYAYDG